MKAQFSYLAYASNQSHKSPRLVLRIIALIIVAAILFACSDNSDPIKQETKDWNVEKFYTEASTALHKKSYTRAIKLYNALEAAYPDGVYARQGLLDLSYAYYQNDQSDLATATLEQFIKTYPTDVNMDYALYLKGYIDYKNDNGILARYTGQDLSERDPTNLQQSYSTFVQLVRQYPDSRFASAAKNKINRLVYAMARGELYKARYYMTIKAYLAALGRAQDIIDKYPNTPVVEEALAIEVAAYKYLGAADLSSKMQEILVLNFPNSKYADQLWKNQDIAWFAFWRSSDSN